MKVKRIIEIINDLTSSVKHGVPHSLTFKPCGKLTKEEREVLQNSLDYDFDLWRETWILPKLEGLKLYLEKELEKKRQKIS